MMGAFAMSIGMIVARDGSCLTYCRQTLDELIGMRVPEHPSSPALKRSYPALIQQKAKLNELLH